MERREKIIKNGQSAINTGNVIKVFRLRSGQFRMPLNSFPSHYSFNIIRFLDEYHEYSFSYNQEGA